MEQRFADTKEKQQARLAHTLASRGHPQSPEPLQSSPALYRLGSWLVDLSGSEPPFGKGPIGQALTLNL